MGTTDDSTINVHPGLVLPGVVEMPPETLPALPGYEVSEKLGGGSYGDVWRGIQLQTGQEVAVKILHPGIHVETLMVEVNRLASVSGHPHVVTLLDANLLHDPPYLVTPLLCGSLEQVASVPALDLRAVERWFEEMLDALHYVHRRGILHCDLKPANVLLDSESKVRILDFGQAAPVGGEVGLHYGTFWFMPPEQALLPTGSGGLPVPTVAWDIYALGATVYQVLTATLPRCTPATEAALRESGDLLRQLQCYEGLLSGSPLVPIRTLNPRVDEDLAAVVQHCLELEPDRRYQGMGDIQEDLRRRRQQLPVAARPHTSGYVLRRFVARNAVPLLAFALIGALQMWQVLVNLGQAQQAAWQRIHDGVGRAHRLYQAFENDRRSWLGVVLQTQATNPVLQRVLLGTNFNTWLNSLQEIVDNLNLPPDDVLMLVTDVKGKVLVRTDQPSPPSENLVAMPLVADVLNNGADDGYGYWQVGPRLYQIGVVPWTKGHYVVGSILVGRRVTTETAQTLGLGASTQLTFATPSQVFSSSFGAADQAALLAPRTAPLAADGTRTVSINGNPYVERSEPLDHDQSPVPASLMLDVDVNSHLEPLSRLEMSYLEEAAGALLLGGGVFGYILWRSERQASARPVRGPAAS